MSRSCEDLPHLGVEECVCVLGEACAEAPGVAWHDAGRSVARTAGVVPRALESGVSYLTSVASLLPLPKSVGCLGPLQPYPL